MNDDVERVARATKPALWRAMDDAPDSEWSIRQRHREMVWAGRAIRETLALLREPGARVEDAGQELVDGFGARGSATSVFRSMLEAFARERDLAGD